MLLLLDNAFRPQRRVTSPIPLTGPAAASRPMNNTTETMDEKTAESTTMVPNFVKKTITA